MIDVKRLITGFLILAAAASSSALIIAGIETASPGTPASPDGSAPSITAAGASGAAAAGTAFLNLPAGQGAAAAAGAVATATSSDQSNLTASLASSLLDNLVAANPAGVQTDANGNPIISAPDMQALAGNLSKSPALMSTDIPNWDIEAAQVKLNIQDRYSAADVQSYASGIKNLVNKYYQASGLEGTLAQGDSASLTSISGLVQSALADAAALPTPAPFAAFQRDFVKVLVYEKNVLAVAANASQDPARASVVLQAEGARYDTVALELGNQWKELTGQTIPPAGPSSEANTAASPFAFLESIFSVRTAHAQIAVEDIPAETAVKLISKFTLASSISVHESLARQILAYAQDIALQILKNALITIVQQKVLAWIQGSGAPRFITQWGTTLANAYTQSALAAIDQQMQCVYPGFAPQMRTTLGIFYAPSGGNSCANTFQQALGTGNTLQNFYDNFSNGGWSAFSASMLPSGNYYGGLYFNAELANAAGEQQQAASIAQFTAGSGFTGSAQCADGSNPNGTKTICTIQGTNISYPAGKNGQCNAGDTPLTLPNGGRCADGSEPKVTSPGAATAQSLSAALKSTVDLITNAKTWTGIALALTHSLLNSLAQSAINYSNQAINNGLNGGGYSDSGLTGVSVGGSTDISASSQPGVTCNPPSQTVTLDGPETVVEFTAIGGATDVACAANNDCPAYENSDGSPIYSWTAQGASSTQISSDTGTLDATYTQLGTFTAEVMASTDNSTSTCSVTIIANPTSTPGTTP